MQGVMPGHYVLFFSLLSNTEGLSVRLAFPVGRRQRQKDRTCQVLQFSSTKQVQASLARVQPP